MRLSPRWIVLILLLGWEPVSAAVTLIDPRATFLRDDTGATNAYILTLSSLSLVPGDSIFLRASGDFDPYGGGNPEELGAAIGIFSSSSTLLGPEIMARVPGAITVGLNYDSGPTYFGTPRDIPEDFFIPQTGLTVQIPAGAQYLFLAAQDSHYGFNADYNNDWGVVISAVPEPTTYGLLGVGVSALVFVARRKQQQNRF
jgi:hypothetical protein